MRAATVIGLLGSIITPASSVFAANFPSHAVICLDDQGNKSPIVSKERLAKALLEADSAASKIYIDVDTINSGFAPKWRAIFTDVKFCATDKACLAPSADTSDSGKDPNGGKKPKPGAKPPTDNNAANTVLHVLRAEAAESIRTATKYGGLYATANPEIGTKYFLSGPNEDPIRCIGVDPPPAAKPYVIQMPPQLRLRANSGDLNINPSKDDASKAAFAGVKPATISYTADSIQGTRVTSTQAALGYAFPIPFGGETPKAFSYLDGEFIPFISANESISKSNGKPATLAATNTVAVGALFNTVAALDDWAGVTHVIAAKPQYIWNTKDGSEIASTTFSYTPWTTLGLTINTPNQIGSNPNALQLIFNIRDDVGEYTKKGNDPVAALAYTNFNRAGSQFGFVVSSDPTGAHVTLNVTETLLYGFVGSIRQLDYLSSSLSFYPDSTSNFGFTLSYTKGTNEDTAQRAQTYTASLSAKF